MTSIEATLASIHDNHRVERANMEAQQAMRSLMDAIVELKLPLNKQ
jgi:hypothetical protein